jgi:hypothetical protein
MNTIRHSISLVRTSGIQKRRRWDSFTYQPKIIAAPTMKLNRMSRAKPQHRSCGRM